jgi:hypothetical protein
MVKNGFYSSFVYSRLIWACLVGKSPVLKDDKSRDPTNPKGSGAFP